MTPPLQLHTSRPRPDAGVLHIAGEVDKTTVAEMEHLLMPRLVATVQVLVVDLTGMDFLCVAGLGLLYQAHLRAGGRDRALRVMATARPVCRALTMAGLDEQLPCHSTVADALAAEGPA